MVTFIDYITGEKIGIYLGKLDKSIKTIEIDETKYCIVERPVLRLKTDKGEFYSGQHPLTELDQTIKLREVEK